ncbi:hypothetical protein EMMF5_005914, partial [Cystobasidiomycetes sp. EMM_F5]
GAQVSGSGGDQGQDGQSSGEVWDQTGPSQQQQTTGRTGLDQSAATNVDTTKPNPNGGTDSGTDPTTNNGNTDSTETPTEDVLPGRKRQVIRQAKRQMPMRLAD